MRTRSVFLTLFVAAVLGCAASAAAQTIDEIMKNMEIVSKGLCTVEGRSFVCARGVKNDEEFFLVYRSDLTLYMVIRGRDRMIIWVDDKMIV